MALEYELNENKASMSFEIYIEIDKALSPPFKKAINNAKSDKEKKLAEDTLRDTREAWEKLSLAIEKGVVTHIIDNMEIYGIKTEGDVNAKVEGKTKSVNQHAHHIDLKGIQNNVEFEQSNDGKGHVK